MELRLLSRGRRAYSVFGRWDVDFEKMICKDSRFLNLAMALKSFLVDSFEVKIRSVVRERRVTEDSHLIS